MIPSRRDAATAGAVVGGITGGLAAVAPAVGLPLAASVTLFCGLAAGLATWAVPRVRWESAPESRGPSQSNGLPVRALLTGGFGGAVVLAFLPPRFVVSLALGVRLALGAITLAAVVLGFAGCAAAVVLVDRRDGEQLVVEPEE